jgi:beta-galactosidase
VRSVVSFNDNWLFHPAEVPASTPDSVFQHVTLPHTTQILPHHNFDVSEYAVVSTYRKHFTLPERHGRRVLLDFDGAMVATTLSINGHTFPEHPGGYTPFAFDITDYLHERGENLLAVRLDSTERLDIPPFGHVVDYLAFGGIYRDVWLRYVEPCYIDNVFVKAAGVLTDHPSLGVETRIANRDREAHRPALRVTLLDQTGQVVASARQDCAAPVGESLHEIVLPVPAAQVERWTLDCPTLYRLKVELVEGGAVSDETTQRFGFREAQFRQDGGFYLNGERIKLVGLNRHQTYPYVGAAAPARLQRQDADILKDELGVNIVRTSHYPQSPHFLDRCDEIGLLVLEEIPGWQHIGDEDWQAITLRDVQAMIERDRNHPSIVLWGVRINESRDNESLYARTNALARRLDPTRQTGGVRYFMESQFLEDVFTFNDFSNDVREPVHTPHLVTEFSGHMFPTKIWDQEERAVEHALRHARIQNRQLGMNRVAGAIGWCAFDYNTHVEFGSGDRICYHGVMDIFRLPKFAAYAYASQVDPARRVVLQAATYWAKGERSVGGFDPLIVFSNCDAIEVFVGENLLGRFQPDRETFPHLPHAPFKVTGFKGFGDDHRHHDLRIVGYVNDKPAAEQRIAADGLPHALELCADDAELCADGADMTRLVFRIVDRFGNRLPYTNQPVSFEVDGPADLIGENPFALMGGQAALYVKARCEPGTVTIRATTPRLPAAEVKIAISR